MNDMNWAPLHPPPPPPSPKPPTLVTFIGDRNEFIRLASRGAALELVTAGFYRFWLATDIRRHLWSNSMIDGDAAEYTGRGKELLIGFLFAMAILVPIYFIYFLITVEAERFKEFASIPLILAFYAFGQFAIYRARRYRLTRTIWRGVRFWMDGSGWAYAWRAVLWGFLVALRLARDPEGNGLLPTSTEAEAEARCKEVEGMERELSEARAELERLRNARQGD